MPGDYAGVPVLRAAGGAIGWVGLGAGRPGIVVSGCIEGLMGAMGGVVV